MYCPSAQPIICLLNVCSFVRSYDKSAKVIFYVLLSGVTTGIGALVGGIIGSISKDIIAFCLSFSAGAMLYIVSGELLPESNNLYKGKISSLGNILGFIIGILSMV